MDKIAYGILSDNDIRNYFGEEIKIYTEDRTGEFKFDLDKQLQLASIDLRFRNDCKRFKNGLKGNLNFDMLKNHNYTEPFEISNSDMLVIDPGEIIFTTTLETVSISNGFAGIITGRSSFARLGIMVHCCQEFINPGQGSPIALQIVNLGKYPVELDIKIPICQLILFKLNTPASNSYSQKDTSKYKNEKDFLDSKIYEEQSNNNSQKDQKQESNNNSQKNQKEQSNNNLQKSQKEQIVNSTVKNQFMIFADKYLLPFLPSIIMLLLITPILQSANNITIFNFFTDLFSAPVSLIVIIICIFLFIYSKKGR